MRSFIIVGILLVISFVPLKGQSLEELRTIYYQVDSVINHSNRMEWFEAFYTNEDDRFIRSVCKKVDVFLSTGDYIFYYHDYPRDHRSRLKNTVEGVSILLMKNKRCVGVVSIDEFTDLKHDYLAAMYFNRHSNVTLEYNERYRGFFKAYKPTMMMERDGMLYLVNKDGSVESIEYPFNH